MDKIFQSSVILLVVSFSLSPLLVSHAQVTEDSWTSKTPMNKARGRLGVAVVNGKIYAIGGDTLHLSNNVVSADWYRGPPVSTNEEYDPLTDTWTFKEPMPTARSHFGIAVYQNTIYCIGGYNSSGETGVNEVYNPQTDSWEIKTPMPTPRVRLTANIVNGKIFLISKDWSGTNAPDVYDPETDTWTTRTPPPYKITSCGSVVVGNKIYLLSTNSTPSNPSQGGFFSIYDTETDSWSFGIPSPTYGVSAAAGLTSGGYAPERIYFFDSYSPYAYDLEMDSWTKGTSMPTARGWPGVAIVNDTFYVVGGILAPWEGYIVITRPTAANEQYTPIGYIPEFPSWTPILLILVVLAVVVVIYKRRLRKTQIH